MTKTKVFLQYVFGIILLILALFMFSDSILGGLIMMSASLICIPKTRFFLEHKFNIIFQKQFKYLIVFFGWISIGIFAKPSKTPISTEDKSSISYGNTNASVISEKQAMPNENTNETLVQDEAVKYNNDGNRIKELQNTKRNVGVGNNKVNTNIESASQEDKHVTQSVSHKTNPRNYNDVNPQHQKAIGASKSANSNSRQYIRGPRGGCYYINSNGNKTYVDHSFCN